MPRERPLLSAEEIGMEVHKLDQFFRVEEGSGLRKRYGASTYGAEDPSTIQW
jgi:hypothetical protein